MIYESTELLKHKLQIKRSIYPVLQQAIERDLTNGRVTDFYTKFAALSTTDMDALFDRYADFINQSEREWFKTDIANRQTVVKLFLAQINSETLPNSRINSKFS